MSCQICGRSACAPSFHSIVEQEHLEKIKEFAEKLIRNGWNLDDAMSKARRALDESSVEDGSND